MKRFLSISIITAALALALVAGALAEGMPTADQSLARFLWGARGDDPWFHDFTGADTLSYAFIFLSPDSTDTLDVTPSGMWFSSDVACTLWTYGDSTLWIDESPRPVKAGEVLTIAARIKWFRVHTTGAGLTRAEALAY